MLHLQVLTFSKENIKYQQNKNCSVLLTLKYIYIEVKCKTQYFIVWVEIYELENKNCIVKTIKKFFTYILHDLRLVEFTDMKPQVQIANCKVIWLHGGSMPLALVLFKYQWYIHHVFSIHSAINEQISSIFWLW